MDEAHMENSVQITDELQKHGLVRVIVALKVEFIPEEELPAGEVKTQRRRIAQAQDRLLRELNIPKEQVVAKMSTLPFLTLWANQDLLKILRNHVLVRAVGYDLQRWTLEE